MEIQAITTIKEQYIKAIKRRNYKLLETIMMTMESNSELIPPIADILMRMGESIYQLSGSGQEYRMRAYEQQQPIVLKAIQRGERAAMPRYPLISLRLKKMADKVQLGRRY
jgi:hypothetical protein